MQTTWFAKFAPVLKSPMITKEIKAVIAALITAFAVYQFVDGNIGNGIMLVLLAGIVVLTIFRNEFILLAFYQLRKQDMDKAQKYLSKIKKPENLVKGQQAYYYYLQGLLTSQTQTPARSEKFFVKALKIGLRMKHDQAMAKLNLAGIYAMKRKKREAINMLNQAKKLDERGMLSDQIKMLKGQLGRI